MREPAFWYRPPSLTSLLLAPVGAVYGAIAVRRMARPGRSVGIPAICIGNYHLGGAGKTPTVLALAALLRERGARPFVVSRGYGGTAPGPLRVDPASHSAADVGDEPLMMATRLPVVVARDRAAGAALAKEQGASVILLDDGFQNPALVKDLSLIVIDAARGIGNGKVFPAGPLRAPLAPQVARTDALIVIGEGDAANNVVAAVASRGVPVLHARLTPDAGSLAALSGQRVLAFAGIGDPERFFRTLRANGVNVAQTRSFADHHPYRPGDLAALIARAKDMALTLVTTEKDMARLRCDARLTDNARDIAVLGVTLTFDDEAKLNDLLTARLSKAR